MSGAASLAGRAALHGGAGLVTVAVPACILQTVASGHPSYMTLPLEDSDGHFSSTAHSALEAAYVRQDAVAMGPGMGQSQAVTRLVRDVYLECPLPVVLDADGLNAFASADGGTRRRCTQGAQNTNAASGRVCSVDGFDYGGHPTQSRATRGCVCPEDQSDARPEGPRDNHYQRKSIGRECNRRHGIGHRRLRRCVDRIGCQPDRAGYGWIRSGLLAVHLHGLAGEFASKNTQPLCLVDGATQVPQSRPGDITWSCMEVRMKLLRRNQHARLAILRTNLIAGLYVLLCAPLAGQEMVLPKRQDCIRIATFNVSLNRNEAGRLHKDLSAGHSQARAVAAIIRIVRPDILLLNELDYSPDTDNAQLFAEMLAADGEDQLGGLPWTCPMFTQLASTLGRKRSGSKRERPHRRSGRCLGIWQISWTIRHGSLEPF